MNKLTTKSTCYHVTNARNQALLEYQNYFKYFTSSFIHDFKKSLKDGQPTISSKQIACASNNKTEIKNPKTQITELMEQDIKLIETIAKLSHNILNATMENPKL